MNRIAVFTHGLWKLRGEIADLTGLTPVKAGLFPPRVEAVAGWGHAPTADRARRFSKQTGKPYIAFTQADAAFDALKGQDKFQGKPIPVRNLVVAYPNRMHVVTVEGTGINKIEDLKGKRVSTGSPGSATEVFAFRVIEAAGRIIIGERLQELS